MDDRDTQKTVFDGVPSADIQPFDKKLNNAAHDLGYIESEGLSIYNTGFVPETNKCNLYS